MSSANTEMKDMAWAIAALTAQIDQADAAIEGFLATNSDEEVELLMKRYVNMCQSGNAREVLDGHLCVAALARGLKEKWSKE
jgi:hypothetical protein